MDGQSDNQLEQMEFKFVLSIVNKNNYNNYVSKIQLVVYHQCIGVKKNPIKPASSPEVLLAPLLEHLNGITEAVGLIPT